MSAEFLDIETILSENQEWTRLDQDWGTPIDLDCEENVAEIKPAMSWLNMNKDFFDPSLLLRNKKVRKQVARNISKRSTNSVLDYKDFLKDLEQDTVNEKPNKQFYLVNGELISAVSVEDICEEIDDVFKSIEKLCAVTSTVKKKVPRSKVKPNKLPAVVDCSISITDLSFDDTQSEKETEIDIDEYIDEVFEDLTNLTSIASQTLLEDSVEVKATVTSLVKRFDSVINSPKVKFNPNRKRECCDKFKELADFWKRRALEKDEQ